MRSSHRRLTGASVESRATFEATIGRLPIRSTRVASALALACVLVAGVACGGPTKKKDAPSSPPSTLRPLGESIYAHTGPSDLLPRLRDITPRVYVPNSVSNTLDVIDPATYQVIATYPVGSQPQHVTPSWDMSTLYVDNDVSDSVTPIDARTGKPGKEFHMRDPYNLYFTPDGTRAITVAERRHAVDFRDGPTLTFIKSLHIPYTGPNHLDFDAAGRFFFISCEFSGWLVRVDVKSMAITGAIYLGGKPTDVRLSPDGTVFFVANERRNGVSVIDPVQMREIQFIPTGKGTHGFVVSRDGKSLYASNRLDGSVSVISFARREVVATWHFGGSPDMGGVSVDGSKLWLSGRYNHDVYVIDTFTGKLLQKIQVGRGPHGVCVFPQPGRYSMGHTGNYR